MFFEILAKFTGTRLCQSFFNKVPGLRPATLIKKEALALVFSCKFCEISKNNFSTEHLQTTASGQIVSNLCYHHWLKMALRRKKRNSESHYLQEKGFHSIFLPLEKWTISRKHVKRLSKHWKQITYGAYGFRRLGKKSRKNSRNSRISFVS